MGKSTPALRRLCTGGCSHMYLNYAPLRRRKLTSTVSIGRPPWPPSCAAVELPPNKKQKMSNKKALVLMHAIIPFKQNAIERARSYISSRATAIFRQKLHAPSPYASRQAVFGCGRVQLFSTFPTPHSALPPLGPLHARSFLGFIPKLPPSPTLHTRDVVYK